MMMMMIIIIQADWAKWKQHRGREFTVVRDYFVTIFYFILFFLS